MNEAAKKRKTNDHDQLWWFAKQYTIEMGSEISIDDVMNDFDKEKENLPFARLQRQEVFAYLSTVLGHRVLKRTRRINGRKTRVLFNVTRKADSLDHEYTSSQTADEQAKDFPANFENAGWILRGKSPMVFKKFTGVVINGNECVLTLKEITKNSFIVIGPFGKKLLPQDFGCSSVDENVHIDVLFLLNYLSTFNLCQGIEVTTHIRSVIRNPNEEGNCFIANFDSKERVVSRTCQQVISGNSRVCHSCKNTQNNVSRRKDTYANIMRTKNCLLSDKEKDLKISQHVQDKKNLYKQKKYWQEAFEKKSITVDELDHMDYSEMLKSLNPSKMTDEMQMLFQQQQQALEKSSTKGHRWHPKIIRLCLEVYSTSPKAFDAMKKFLILPSKRTISYYKNSISHSSGWNDDVMNWCRKEADRLNLKDEDRWSGLIFDEMTIQEDLEFIKVGGEKKLVGAVALGKSYQDQRFLTTGTDEIELATKVMQFALVTDGGFRFVLAHLPVKSMPAEILLEKFWEGVDLCERAGFRIYWLLCDGGEPNRSFVKLLFPYGSDPAEHNFVARNMHTGYEIVVMADCKHNFKKIRNHLEKSSSSQKTPRKLTVNNKLITFEFWKSAFEWDQSSHSMPIHESLRDDHFDLNAGSRMRNKLAEDVLNDRMLFLMKKYKEHLVSQQKQAEADAVEESVKLLTFTSSLIDLFTRKDLIYHIYDKRLLMAKKFLRYLEEWKENCTNSKEFLSDKLWMDIRSMIIGLEQVVRIKTTKFPGSAIKPILVNQDIIENVFCQIRATNGQNNHPKYYMYTASLMSVRVGQSVISKKGNTNGTKEALPMASLPCAHPFRRKKHQ